MHIIFREHGGPFCSDRAKLGIKGGSEWFVFDPTKLEDVQQEMSKWKIEPDAGSGGGGGRSGSAGSAGSGDGAGSAGGAGSASGGGSAGSAGGAGGGGSAGSAGGTMDTSGGGGGGGSGSGSGGGGGPASLSLSSTNALQDEDPASNDSGGGGGGASRPRPTPTLLNGAGSSPQSASVAAGSGIHLQPSKPKSKPKAPPFKPQHHQAILDIIAIKPSNYEDVWRRLNSEHPNLPNLKEHNEVQVKDYFNKSFRFQECLNGNQPCAKKVKGEPCKCKKHSTINYQRGDKLECSDPQKQRDKTTLYKLARNLPFKDGGVVE